MKPRRVVITGLGLVTPLGVGVADTWASLIEGRSAVRRENLIGEGGEERQLAARVPSFSIRSFVSDRKLLRLMCQTDRFGLAAAQMAASEAGRVTPPPERKGAFIGSGKEMGPIEDLFDAMRASREDTGEMASVRLGRDGFGLIPPLTLVSGLPNGCLFAVSVLHSIKGGGSNLLGSGEIGLAAIGAAYRAVQRGQVDWVLAGGHDSGVDRWSYGDFYRVGLLSRQVDDPERAVKPFDRRRDGFAVGEGAGMAVVEELESAQRRGASILAEVIGYAESCDAAGMVGPRPDGRALANAITATLKQAEGAPEDVDYVCAYGSATVAGDRSEMKALEQVFGEGERRPLVSGTKGAMGHLLGASGAVELAITVLALQHQVAPGTLNLEEPDPESTLDYVPGQARPAPLKRAITISRGIGGQNAVMALRRWEA